MGVEVRFLKGCCEGLVLSRLALEAVGAEAGWKGGRKAVGAR